VWSAAKKLFKNATMITTNYFSTFISVAEDCPVTVATVPPSKEPKSVAQIQYELLKDSAHQFTSDDILYVSNGERRGLSRNDFFNKGQPCFRASPLSKQYGWSILSDGQGKIALVAMQSDAYGLHQKNLELKQIKAMRSARK
jgi:hypothetical protein